MRKLIFIVFGCFLIQSGFSQAQEKMDTLDNITVSAFENHRKLLEVAAPVSVIRSQDLNNYNNISIVNAMNMTPGVNMDERSPGSYRLNIRGSTVRSPFGVRNVKVYYNDIPFTDPGGNTYLQILGFYNYNSIEIIKGPSGSMYGSGNGGVMMINDMNENNDKRISFTYGSYNTQSILAESNFSNNARSISIKYNRQSSNGYRDHTAMHRDVVSINTSLKNTEKFKLRGTFLYGSLYYETPGALTLSEYLANPKSARPKAGIFPSAQQADAHFTLNYFLSGLTSDQKISNHIKNQLTIYGAYAQNRNPNFRNFSRTSEPHFGARTNFTFSKKYKQTLLQINMGGEYQHSFYSQRVYDNNSGQTGLLQTDDEVFNTQALGYLQAQVQLANGISITAGSSINIFTVDFNQFSDPVLHFQRRFKNELAPRFSISKKFKKDFVLYGTISKGFSPPSIGELLPSTDIFNESLLAEKGLNYEAGARASIIQRRLLIDLSLFKMNLTNSITQERDNSGADYFVNSGGSGDNGIEIMANYYALSKPSHFLKNVVVNLSANLYNFKYKNYKPLGNDYSDNKIPGASSVRYTGSVFMETTDGTSLDISALHNGKIALNDANSVFAKPYSLLDAKLAHNFATGKSKISVFTGVQNIFNETYSLGNDINAAGGRFYNAASGRSFYAGITFTF